MKNFNKIFAYILPYKRYALLILLFYVLTVLFSLFSFTMAIPFLRILFNKNLVTETIPLAFSYHSVEQNFNFFLSKIIVEYGNAKALLVVSFLVVTMVMFKTGFWFLSNYFMANIRNNVIRDIRNRLYSKAVSLPLSYYSNERKGDIMSRMTGDVQEIEFSIIRSLEVMFKEPITIIVYLFSLLFMSYQLTLFVFVMLPIAGLIIGRLGKNLRKGSFAAQVKMGTLLSIIDETLTGLRVIKAFNSEKKMANRFSEENEIYTKLMIRMTRRNYLATPLSEFLGTLIVIIIMWYGGTLVLNHSSILSSEAFIGYLIIFSQIINPAKSFSTSYYAIQKGMASADRIEQVMSAENTINEKVDAKPIKQFSQKIELKDVSFRYGENEILKHIDLQVEKGKSIALVGQSGSGKSTLVDLLARFYDVVEGEISIDGIPIKDLKIKDLRNLMGNVNQEPILFNDTIFNNIAFGVENATMESVIAAAKVANAHDFIMEAPDGYQTNIGDRGSKLSGGQRQRLSIARAVLKNPPIMILDEATSSLDTESERLVQDALTNLMKNRTSVVIAHRLSTVRNVDEIVVLHEGKIAERGTHDELQLKENGIYKKLLNLQQLIK